MCQLTCQYFSCDHLSSSALQTCDYWKSLHGSEALPAKLCPSFSRSARKKNRKNRKEHCQTCINEALTISKPPSHSLKSAKWAPAISYCGENGGATANWQTGAILQAPEFVGFMVGGVVQNNNYIPRWSRNKSLVSSEATALDIEAFVQRPEHQLVFKTPSKNLTLGLWISTEKDRRGRVVLDNEGNPVERLYIDISQAFRSQYCAIAMAIARRELGIFMITPDYKNMAYLDTSPRSRAAEALRAAMDVENDVIASKWRGGTPCSRLRSTQSAESPRQHQGILETVEWSPRCATSTMNRGSKRNSPHDGFDGEDDLEVGEELASSDSGIDLAPGRREVIFRRQSLSALHRRTSLERKSDLPVRLGLEYGGSVAREGTIAPSIESLSSPVGCIIQQMVINGRAGA